MRIEKLIFSTTVRYKFESGLDVRSTSKYISYTFNLWPVQLLTMRSAKTMESKYGVLIKSAYVT